MNRDYPTNSIHKLNIFNNENSEIIFSIAIGDLQEEANYFLDRDLTDNELEKVIVKIEEGLIDE